MKRLLALVLCMGVAYSMDKVEKAPQPSQKIEKKEEAKPADSKDSKEKKPNAFVRAITCCCSSKK